MYMFNLVFWNGLVGWFNGFNRSIFVHYEAKQSQKRSQGSESFFFRSQGTFTLHTPTESRIAPAFLTQLGSTARCQYWTFNGT